MGGLPHQCGRRRLFRKVAFRKLAFRNLILAAASALALTACGGDGGGNSDQVAAMKASDGGDQKTAASLARKEVARYADQC